MKKLLLSSVFLLLTACSTGGDTSSGPIRIGYLGPLTGDAAAYGKDTLNGMKLKVEEVNAAGGIGGRMVEVIAEDGRCSGAESASAAQKLVNIDGVVGIIGGQCSSETLAAAPIAELGGVPLISPVSSSPDVTDAGDFIFRVFPSDALKTIAMAQYFEQKGYTRVAMIGDNTDFTSGFAAGLEVQIGAEAFVLKELLEPGTKDYRSVLARISPDDVDVFVANGQSNAVIGTILQQIREAGFQQEIVSHDAADSLELIELSGGNTDNVHFVTTPSAGEGGAFSTAYTDAYGEPPNISTFAALSYDAAGILLDAIAQAGTDGPAVRDALYALENYDGVAGSFHFDGNGDVLGLPLVLKGFEDGKIIVVQEIAVD